MHGRRWLALFSLVAGMALPLRATAHEGHLHRVLGSITAVDAAHIEVRSREGESVSVLLEKETRVRRGEKLITAAEVKTGERVAVSYVEKEGRKLAREVRLGGAQAPARTPAPPQTQPSGGRK